MTPRKKRGGHGGVRPGAGRPRTIEDPVSYRVNIEREDFDALRKMADGTGTSATEIVREAIRKTLARYFRNRRRKG